MFYTTPIIDTAVASVFSGLPYSPALLLDARLGAPITDVPAFSEGCKIGFGGYFDTVNNLGNTLQLLSEVRCFMLEIAMDKTGPSWISRCCWFYWNVGYGVGWLSVLALSQYSEAMEGLRLLAQLVECLEGEHGLCKEVVA